MIPSLTKLCAGTSAPPLPPDDPPLDGEQARRDNAICHWLLVSADMQCVADVDLDIQVRLLESG